MIWLAVRLAPRIFSSHAALCVPVLLAAVAVLTLQGCWLPAALRPVDTSCDLGGVYALVRLNGRAGMNKSALHKAGVRFCARHLLRPETYANGGCMEPQALFPEGRLPSYNHADQHALLLVTCRDGAFASDGSDVQRITCSDDVVGEDDYGELRKEPRLHFNNDDSTDCRTGGTPEAAPVDGGAADVTDAAARAADAADALNATNATNATSAANATNVTGITGDLGRPVVPHPNVSSRRPLALSDLGGANVSGVPPRGRKPPRRGQRWRATVEGSSHLSLQRVRGELPSSDEAAPPPT